MHSIDSNLVRVQNVAFLYCKLEIRKNSKFEKKFENFFWQFNFCQKNKKIKFFSEFLEDIQTCQIQRIFFWLFLPVKIFYLISSKFLKSSVWFDVWPLKFGSARVRLLEVWFGSSSKKSGSFTSLIKTTNACNWKMPPGISPSSADGRPSIHLLKAKALQQRQYLCILHMSYVWTKKQAL